MRKQAKKQLQTIKESYTSNISKGTNKVSMPKSLSKYFFQQKNIHQEHLNYVRLTYPVLRQIREDGNTLYRATAFAILENLFSCNKERGYQRLKKSVFNKLLNNDLNVNELKGIKIKLDTLGNHLKELQLRCKGKSNQQISYEICKYFCEYDQFDKQIICILRLLAYQGYKDVINHIAFIQQKGLRQFGQEAGKEAVSFLARTLQIGFTVQQITEQGSNQQKINPNSNIQIHLLKHNHYHLLYLKNKFSSDFLEAIQQESQQQTSNHNISEESLLKMMRQGMTHLHTKRSKKTTRTTEEVQLSKQLIGLEFQSNQQNSSQIEKEERNKNYVNEAFQKSVNIKRSGKKRILPINQGTFANTSYSVQEPQYARLPRQKKALQSISTETFEKDMTGSEKRKNSDRSHLSMEKNIYIEIPATYYGEESDYLKGKSKQFGKGGKGVVSRQNSFKKPQINNESGEFTPKPAPFDKQRQKRKIENSFKFQSPKSNSHQTQQKPKTQEKLFQEALIRGSNKKTSLQSPIKIKEYSPRKKDQEKKYLQIQNDTQTQQKKRLTKQVFFSSQFSIMHQPISKQVQYKFEGKDKQNDQGRIQTNKKIYNYKNGEQLFSDQKDMSREEIKKSRDKEKKYKDNWTKDQNKDKYYTQNVLKKKSWKDNIYQSKKEIPYQSRKEIPYQSRKEIPYQNRKDGPYQSRKEIPYQSRKEIPYQSRKDGPYQSRKEISYQSRNEGPYQSRKEIPYQNKKEGPYQSRKEIPYQSRKEGPYQSRKEISYKSRKEGPYQSRKEISYKSRKEGPYQSRKEIPYQNEKEGPYQSMKEIPYQSRNQSKWKQNLQQQRQKQKYRNFKRDNTIRQKFYPYKITVQQPFNNQKKEIKYEHQKRKDFPKGDYKIIESKQKQKWISPKHNQIPIERNHINDFYYNNKKIKPYFVNQQKFKDKNHLNQLYQQNQQPVNLRQNIYIYPKKQNILNSTYDKNQPHTSRSLSRNKSFSGNQSANVTRIPIVPYMPYAGFSNLQTLNINRCEFTEPINKIITQRNMSFGCYPLKIHRFKSLSRSKSSKSNKTRNINQYPPNINRTIATITSPKYLQRRERVDSLIDFRYNISKCEPCSTYYKEKQFYKEPFKQYKFCYMKCVPVDFCHQNKRYGVYDQRQQRFVQRVSRSIRRQQQQFCCPMCHRPFNKQDIIQRR